MTIIKAKYMFKIIIQKITETFFCAKKDKLLKKGENVFNYRFTLYRTIVYIFMETTAWMQLVPKVDLARLSFGSNSGPKLSEFCCFLSFESLP